jgi:DNA-binding NarL/FixJ family response regulator
MIRLSPSEVDTLAHLRNGDDIANIARATGRTENTVAHHLKSAIRKLGVSGRQQAIVKAEADGLI